MNRVKLSGIIAAAAILGLSAPAMAQTSERVWEQGSVWTVSYIETKPGHFNAYVKDLSHVWKKFLDEQKKDGDVLSYRMLAVQNPRDEEPDLILMVEFKNMAALDRSPAYFEEITKRLMGSLDQMQKANIDRGALRELRGSVLTRELHFKP